MDLKALYQDVINEHNNSPTHKGLTEDATFTLRGLNPSCGDDIFLQLKVDSSGVISEGSFSGKGCAISQASVDMMLDLVIGKTQDEAIHLASLFLGMIRGDVQDEGALEPLDEALALQNIRLMPARVKCAVLGWHTMEEMLKNGRTSGMGSADHCSTE